MRLVFQRCKTNIIVECKLSTSNSTLPAYIKMMRKDFKRERLPAPTSVPAIQIIFATLYFRIVKYTEGIWNSNAG